MNERQEHLLKVIVESYIERAEPVGSAFVVENERLGVSPATVRNDMAALEAEGYVSQPHISAGRVPTESGYEYYLRHLLSESPPMVARKKLERAVHEEDTLENILKDLAMALVELSGETVVLSFGPRRAYYAGLSNLFQKPEFQDLAILSALSESIDRFETVLDELEHLLEREPRVFIGRHNPFGARMSSVVCKYRAPNASGLLGLVGPMRMDYGRNMQLLQMTQELLESTF